MHLRVRCPKCSTIQRVPLGVRPICPKCGFAGNSTPAQAMAQAQQAEAESGSAQQATWQAAEGQGWGGAPAEGEWTFTEQEPSQAPVEGRKKRRWFG